MRQLFGVMKRSLKIGMSGDKSFKTMLSANDIQQINTVLVAASNTQPFNFNRKIRHLDYISSWKGKEFRTFLLYVGPVALRNVLSSEIYNHFLLLHSAARIVTSDHYLNCFLVAEKMLRKFDYIFDYIIIFAKISTYRGRGKSPKSRY